MRLKKRKIKVKGDERVQKVMQTFHRWKHELAFLSNTRSDEFSSPLFSLPQFVWAVYIVCWVEQVFSTMLENNKSNYSQNLKKKKERETEMGDEIQPQHPSKLYQN